MDEAELRSVFERIDAMNDRVDKVIAREKPLRADVSYPAPKVAKPTPKVAKPVRVSPLRGSTGYSAIASGSLTGNEMRLSDYRPQPRDDDDPTGIWAAFEADFDAMVAGMH